MQSETDTLPVVSAGVSQGVFSGEVVILEGEASTSIPSALPLTYSWERSNNVSSTDSGVTSRSVDDSDALSTFAISGFSAGWLGCWKPPCPPPPMANFGLGLWKAPVGLSKMSGGFGFGVCPKGTRANTKQCL